jgi:hypothetical protein
MSAANPTWKEVDGAWRLMVYTREVAVIRETLGPGADGVYWVTLDQGGESVDTGQADDLGTAKERAEAAVRSRGLHVWQPIQKTHGFAPEIPCPYCGVPLFPSPVDEDGGVRTCEGCGSSVRYHVTWEVPHVDAELVLPPEGKTLMEVFKEHL